MLPVATGVRCAVATNGGGQQWEPAEIRAEPQSPDSSNPRPPLGPHLPRHCAMQPQRAPVAPSLVFSKRGGVRRPPRRCPRLDLVRLGGGDRPTLPPSGSGPLSPVRTRIHRPPRRRAHPAGRRHVDARDSENGPEAEAPGPRHRRSGDRTRGPAPLKRPPPAHLSCRLASRRLQSAVKCCRSCEPKTRSCGSSSPGQDYGKSSILPILSDTPLEGVRR
jgi:hypothetical protein